MRLGVSLLRAGYPRCWAMMPATAHYGLMPATLCSPFVEWPGQCPHRHWHQPRNHWPQSPLNSHSSSSLHTACCKLAAALPGASRLRRRYRCHCRWGCGRVPLRAAARVPAGCCRGATANTPHAGAFLTGCCGGTAAAPAVAVVAAVVAAADTAVMVALALVSQVTSNQGRRLTAEESSA